MVVSFLGDVERRDRDTHLLGQSLLELPGKRSQALAATLWSGAGGGDGDLWERGRFTGII